MLFHMSLLLKGEEADGLRIMLASKDKLGPKIHSAQCFKISEKVQFWEVELFVSKAKFDGFF